MVIRSLLRLQRFQYSVLVERHPQKPQISRDVVRQLEQDGARFLRIAKKRVEERINLLRQESPDPSSAREIKELEPIHNAWDEWTRTTELFRETLPLLDDPDPSMRSLALCEYETLTSTLSHYIYTLFPALLVPKSTTGHLSAIIELKSGAGGSEASLFLSDLLRMYLRLSSSAGWKAHIISNKDTDDGGTKDAIVEIKSAGSYDTLRWETGVHRVQRIPATEASGRVHTSTVAVWVLPLSEDDETAMHDDLYSLDDVKVEVMRSRGAGGQHVNKTESAVRLTHKPTGITVSIQDERSQHQNKRRAFQILRARLMDVKLTKEAAERRTLRQELVKTADRSQKIRTYNYPQDRVTDHRIKLSFVNLTSVMQGDGLQVIIDALRRDHEATIVEELLEDV